MKLVISLFLFLFIANNLLALTTVIKGKAETYSGDKIEIYTYSDYITNEKIIIGELSFEKDGSFIFNCELENITLVFIDLYVFRGNMFLEPGKTYEISLPDKTLPDNNDRFDPFFQPSEIDVFINNGAPGDLNDIIGSFDLSLNRFIIKNLGFTYGDFRSQADAAAYLLDSVFDYNNSSFFQNYKSNKLKQLKQMAYRMDAVSSIRYFFTSKAILVHNPGFMELFNNVFQDFFLQYSKTPAGNGLTKNLISYQSYYLLKKQMQDDYFLFNNDSLADLAILKGIHDGFTNFSLDVGKYKNQIPETQLLALLDSFCFYCPIEEYKPIAKNIKNKFTRLMRGYPAPKFSLTDQNNITRSLDEFKGKYVYLNFTKTWNYTSQQEFDLMEAATKKYKDSLEIVTIVCDGSLPEMITYLEEKPRNWTFLHFNDNKQLLRDYNIMAFPMFYVIDKEGMFFLSPANPPSENFEKQFIFSFKKPDQVTNPWFDNIFDVKPE